MVGWENLVDFQRLIFCAAIGDFVQKMASQGGDVVLGGGRTTLGAPYSLFRKESQCCVYAGFRLK